MPEGFQKFLFLILVFCFCNSITSLKVSSNSKKTNFFRLKSVERTAVIVGGLMVSFGFGISTWGTFNTAADIPANYFKEKQIISGKVVRVADGDTFRMRHTPNFLSTGDVSGALADNTIVVRIAAVDTPETAKFGNKGQSLGKTATDFTKSRLLNKKVKVKLLSRDQYGRVVGLVTYSDSYFSSKDISEELLKKGLAVVYRQKGGQYGDGGIKKWDAIENAAKKKRLGIWGQDTVELPSDYKKKVKGNSVHEEIIVGVE